MKTTTFSIRMLLVFLVCGALCSGCAGYKIGPVKQTAYRSIAVPMLKNRTYHPQLEQKITNAIIKGIQTDGSLLVKSVDDADVVMTGEITRYLRIMMRGQRLDTTVPSEFRYMIYVQIEAHDRVTGKSVLPLTTVTGYADSFTGMDQQSAEQQVLPLVADDVAKRAVSLLVEKW
jgi:hypothetical protein